MLDGGTSGNPPAFTCWQRQQPRVRAMTKPPCPDAPCHTCVPSSSPDPWEAGPRNAGAWHRRPLAIATKETGSQAHMGPTTQYHQLLISCLYFRPSLEGLLIVKPQDTPITLTGEPLLSHLILATFCCKRGCWLRPAFLREWLCWGQYGGPPGPAELHGGGSTWGVCFKGCTATHVFPASWGVTACVSRYFRFSFCI